MLDTETIGQIPSASLSDQPQTLGSRLSPLEAPGLAWR